MIISSFFSPIKLSWVPIIFLKQLNSETSKHLKNSTNDRIVTSWPSPTEEGEKRQAGPGRQGRLMSSGEEDRLTNDDGN